MNHRLLGIVWPFVAVTVLLAALGIVSLDLMSAARAFVGGESLWSKGQKDAVYHLDRYAATRAPQEYALYRAAIVIPDGDRRARLALDREPPDLAAARQGLIAGRNHPDDVPGMIRLYRHFRGVDALDRAIRIWATGDRRLAELAQVAAELHAGIRRGAADAAALDRLRARIHDLNGALTPLEIAFSDALGEASRQTRMLLIALNLAVAGMLIGLAVWRTRALLRQSEGFERALHTSEQRAQVTLASIGDAVITTDLAGRIDYMNPVAETITGWPAGAAKGQPLDALLRLVDEGSRQLATDPLGRVLSGDAQGEVQHNLLLVRRDGSETAVDKVVAPIRDHAARITGAALVLHDMTRERHFVAKLSWQASHDALTGLVNRREFEQRLQVALDSAARRQGHHAVMYLDLDQFKVVNDTGGHAAGDELLRELSTRLQQRLREGDTLARLGGDEFGVLLENCPPEPALQIAEALRQSVIDFQLGWGSRTFSVGVSIGLVNLHDGAMTLEDILSAADAACYLAKEKGRNRVQVYREGDAELSVRQGEMEWVNRIHRALDEDRFCLYFQPIAPLRGDGDAPGVHFELLVRLADEQGRIVPPSVFIPAAERYGLMSLIDRWVVRTALATLAVRLPAGPTATSHLCAINLSGVSVGDDAFLDYIREQFAETGVAPARVCFEVTETSAVANLERATRFIQQLRTMGCRFSLDDFGAGMSSFGYLKHLPVDYLKIDGSFVRDMLSDPIDRAMVEAINHIGHVMGKRTIAEFVETDAIVDALRDIGVDYAQGFGIARPQPFTRSVEVPAGAVSL